MSDKPDCGRSEALCAWALGAVQGAEAASLEAHAETCFSCRQELQALRPVIASFAAWPKDVVAPAPSLKQRLAERIARETGSRPVKAEKTWREPEWEQVAPGIERKVLAEDFERSIVSMLVRLAPGGSYPPHIHAGVEELHLLSGELWIDERKLFPGDYSRATPGTGDQRVYSETGCTCVLITSVNDELK